MSTQQTNFEILKSLGTINKILINKLVQIDEGNYLNSPLYAYRCEVIYSTVNDNFKLLSNFKSKNSFSCFQRSTISDIIILLDENNLQEFSSYVENFKIFTLDPYSSLCKEDNLNIVLSAYKVLKDFENIKFLNNRKMLVSSCLTQVVVINNRHDFTIRDVMRHYSDFMENFSKFYEWIELEFLHLLLKGDLKDISVSLDTSRYHPLLYIGEHTFSTSKSAFNFLFTDYISQKENVISLFKKYNQIS